MSRTKSAIFHEQAMHLCARSLKKDIRPCFVSPPFFWEPLDNNVFLLDVGITLLEYLHANLPYRDQ